MGVRDPRLGGHRDRGDHGDVDEGSSPAGVTVGHRRYAGKMSHHVGLPLGKPSENRAGRTQRGGDAEAYPGQPERVRLLYQGRCCTSRWPKAKGEHTAGPRVLAPTGSRIKTGVRGRRNKCERKTRNSHGPSPTGSKGCSRARDRRPHVVLGLMAPI